MRYPWRVEFHDDLSAVWLSLYGYDFNEWHACVEESRLVDGLAYDAWFIAPGVAIHLGPFDSIEAARRTAQGMAEQYLADNGLLDAALLLGDELPEGVRFDLRLPEEFSYNDAYGETWA